MTTVRSGVPGHGDGAAFVRLRWGKLVDDPSGQRVQDNPAEGLYEIVCPGCGDDPGTCAESGACAARRRAPRPRLWITSACRPADNPRAAWPGSAQPNSSHTESRRESGRTHTGPPLRADSDIVALINRGLQIWSICASCVGYAVTI
jgi:hypothetical protein